MATEDLRFYDGTSWQSLSALAAEQVDAKLPIESDNGTVELTGESETFDVKINDVSQLTVGNDIDFNIPFNNGQFTITGSSYTQQRIKSSKGGCMTQFTAAAGKSYFIGMSDLYGFQVIGTKFSNTKISATDDTFRVFGSPIYTDGVWGNGEKQLVIDASKAEFSIPVWAPRIVGNADNAAFVNLGNSVQIQAGTISGEVVIDSGTTELKAIRDAKVAIKGQNTTQLQVATNTDYCFIQTTNKDNRSFYHGQDPDGWSVYYTGSAKALGCNADGVFKFEKSFCTPGVQGYNSTDASITIGLELLTSNHTPTQPNSIATKKTVDDKIWVGTTAEYNALTKNPTTLYCLTD